MIVIRAFLRRATRSIPLLAVVAALCVAGCKKDGPAENFGERIDDAVSDARDRVEEAGDEVREAADEVGDALRDNQ